MYINIFHQQGAALLGGVNALHTAFPENAEEEYRCQGSVFSLSLLILSWICYMSFIDLINY